MPVIVVGNISVGGTGKTPLVKALAVYLSEQGWQSGIIARGYGGTSQTWPRVVHETDDSKEVGDEPLMLRQSCDVPVAVGPDRLASVNLLVEQHRCNIIVSDDGFQHLALGRDVNIVVIDGEAQFGNGWCLPSGPLRESRSALKKADMVVVNSPTPPPSQGQFVMTIVNQVLIKLNDRTVQKPLSDFATTDVHAVAGLGNPERFFAALEQAGLKLTRHTFPDHHRYEAVDFAFADHAENIILTEKDAVKCGTIELPDNTWILPIQAQLGRDFFETLQLKLDQSKDA